MAQPVIGLTLDHEPPGGYSKTHPWYALRENYCEAVAEAGGLSVLLPHEPERARDYLGLLDGLIVTGGAFDVDPALFGAKTKHQTVATKDRRTSFELAICKAALAQDMPVLGICGGEQLLNVAPDGVIEGIEDPKRRFVLGVQWHPEYRLSDGDRRIFAAFIQAARG